MLSLAGMSNVIAEKISLHLQLDNDKEEVIAYGAFNLIHTLWSTILLIIFGLVFNSLIEILLISITAALLRQLSGGVHASSPGRCSTITVITFGILSLFVRYTNLTPAAVVYYQLTTSVIILYSLYKNCPIDTPNKPIREETQRIRLRKRSFIFLVFIYIVMAILWFLFINNRDGQVLKIILSLHTGILWQSFLLTYLGNGIISKFDYYLGRII